MNSSPIPQCPFCSVTAEVERDPVAAPPRESVYLGAGWRVRAHRSALAGWALVIPRRHVASLHELTDPEAVELGLLLRDLTRVHVEEFGALKSYVMQFAEGTPHAHFSVGPRMPDQPQDRLGARSQAYSADEPLSEGERDDVARRMAAAWPRSAATADVVFTSGTSTGIVGGVR